MNFLNFLEIFLNYLNFLRIFLEFSLIHRGLVSVVRHRQDEPRAENYDQLLIAEDKAKAAKKGLYGKDTSRSMNRVDYSGNATKAKTNLHFLKQKKRHDAIIEYVFTASHYLIYIPAENCQISFTLQVRLVLY